MNWIKTFWNLQFILQSCLSFAQLTSYYIQSSSQWSTKNLISDFKNAPILICSLETWRASEISKFFNLGRFLWQWVDYSKQNNLLRYHMSCCIIDTFSLPHNGPSGNCAYIYIHTLRQCFTLVYQKCWLLLFYSYLFLQ